MGKEFETGLGKLRYCKRKHVGSGCDSIIEFMSRL